MVCNNSYGMSTLMWNDIRGLACWRILLKCHSCDRCPCFQNQKKKNTLHLWLELEPYACALVSATRLIIIKNTKWHYYPFSLSTFFMPNTKRHCGSFGHSLLALRNCFHISWYILIELTSMMIYISQALGLINSTKKESFPRYQKLLKIQHFLPPPFISLDHSHLLMNIFSLM